MIYLKVRKGVDPLMKTLTVRFDDEEFKILKMISQQTGITMTALVKQGLELRKKQLTGNDNINFFEVKSSE